MERTFREVVKFPSALIPVAMSLAALAVIGVAAIFGGLMPSKDEGTSAHLWQLFMGGQLPVLAFFAGKWLPRAPKAALAVLCVQLGAALTAMAPVFLLHL